MPAHARLPGRVRPLVLLDLPIMTSAPWGLVDSTTIPVIFSGPQIKCKVVAHANMQAFSIPSPTSLYSEAFQMQDGRALASLAGGHNLRAALFWSWPAKICRDHTGPEQLQAGAWGKRCDALCGCGRLCRRGACSSRSASGYFQGERLQSTAQQ